MQNQSCMSASHSRGYGFDPVPNHKILNLSKLKKFADEILKVAQMVEIIPNRVENNVRKGENNENPECFPSPRPIIFKSFLFQGH